MKYNLKKVLVVSGLAVIMGVTSFGPMVSASTTTTTKTVKTVKAHKRTLSGKVTSITGSTIKMSKGGQTYTIEASGVTPVNKKGAAISMSDIKVGHRITAKGTLSGTTMSSVTKLRDTTLTK